MHWKNALLVTVSIILGITIVDQFVLSPGVRLLVLNSINLLAPLLALYWIITSLQDITQPRDRLSWLFVSWSMLLFSVYWHLTTFVLHHNHPLWADGLFLIGFLLLWIGLLIRPGEFPREKIGKLIVLFDIIISTGSAISISVQLSFPSLVFSPETPPMIRMQGMLYPIVALVTLICVNLMLLQNIPRHQHPPRALKVLGIGFLLLGGLWSVYLSLVGITTVPFFCQALWPVGFLFYGVAARWEMHRQQRPMKLDHNIDPFPSISGMLVPVVLVLAAMVLMLHSLVQPFNMDPNRQLFILFSLVGLIILTLVRQVLTFESNRQLYVTLQYLYTQMAQNAATDHLTGLSNHGYFMERIDQEMHRARRYQRSLALIFADLDYFKQINDTFGHHAGDQALQVVAHMLECSVRDIDLVARYGGEEFVVLLPETSLEQAARLAERLRTIVSGIDLPFLREAERGLSLSCGVASYPETAISSDNLLHSADQAMYRAKREGRNRVIVATSLRHLAV